MHKKTIIDLHNDLKNNIITADELFESSYKHIEQVNKDINAVTSQISSIDVVASESLLSNIPFACKDLIATKGLVTANASIFLENFVPVYDASIYTKLKNNNAQLVAKTNMDEFGMGGLNINTVIGPSCNPYDLSCSTGGSSGGSAALVASGCVPYAIGTDTGDSVRRPAAFCGVYGYKPTWGAISRYGVFPYASSLDHVGIFTRCIPDLAIVFDAISGYDQRDAATYNYHEKDFHSNLNGTTKFKIAYLEELNNTFSNKTVQDNFTEIKEYLSSLNHEVVKANISYDLLKLISPTYQVISNVEASSNLGDITGVAFGNRIEAATVNESITQSRSAGLSKYTKVRLALGAIAIKEENKNRYYYKAKQVRQIFIDTFDKLFSEYDLIIAPSINNGAVKNQADHSNVSNTDKLISSNYLSIANLIGAPSLHIPTHLNDGLPYGISVMAKPFNDQTVFDFAYGFENGLKENGYKNIISFYNRYVKEVK